jgi:hypothetical protein
MNAETKTHSTSSVQVCQNCKNEFLIESEDFDFYEKVKVPAPTFCPECRIVRRMSWRNERTLYHRKCDLPAGEAGATGKDIITMFAPEQPVLVYERDYWWSDKWDQLASGRDYDFSKPFFQQFRDLFEKAPLPNLANSNSINSEYGNHGLDIKNCYLHYASLRCEDSAYITSAIGAKNSLDLDKTSDTTQCYSDTLCGNLNHVSFSYDSDDSVNCDFLHACKNLIDCLGCINLRNKSNCIFNQQYTKEEYKIERAKYDFGSYKGLIEFRKKFVEFIKQQPRRYGFIHKCINCVGDNILNSKNVYMGFDIFGNVEDCKYLIWAMDLRDSYDGGPGYGLNTNNCYEALDTGDSGTKIRFAIFTHSCQNTNYTYVCKNCQDLFGCVGLRSKRYCILNKQYTKEEYEELVPKIIVHMNEMPYTDKKGRVYKYGEFFPTELSPFAYNETIAQEYYPKNKAEILDAGFRWREPDTKQYKVTIQPADLPDHIKDVSDDILNQVIACEHGGSCNHQCIGAFKIIPSELAFYRRMNLALPRLCSNCRHYARLAQRTPFKLWDRTCAKCGKEIKTSYAPNRPEIIYCEACYNQEVA